MFVNEETDDYHALFKTRLANTRGTIVSSGPFAGRLRKPQARRERPPARRNFRILRHSADPWEPLPISL